MTQRQHQALFETAISCIVAEAARAAGDHCEYSAWAASIQSLVPRRYEFSSAASDTSNDGAARLTEWYGPNWDQVHAAPTLQLTPNCVAIEPQVRRSTSTTRA